MMKGIQNSKWTLILALLMCLGGMARAQERKVQYKPFIDERRFHYGFFVGKTAMYMSRVFVGGNGSRTAMIGISRTARIQHAGCPQHQLGRKSLILVQNTLNKSEVTQQ